MSLPRKQIFLSGSQISYTLKRFRRSKCVRLSVSRDRALLVTAPTRTPLFFIESVLKRHEEWILGSFAKFLSAFPVTASSKRSEYREHKEKARVLVTERLDFWNTRFGFRFGRVSIRNTKTRWGSCSKKGNLNFSYKLALLPIDLADYIVVHELCHLKEFNHSKNFWNLVSSAVPDYRERKKRLRQYPL